MLKHVSDWKEARELLLHLLPVSGSLAGLSIASLSLFQYSGHHLRTTVADDLLAFSALAFLLACYFIFWALRTRRETRALRLGRMVDTMFLAGLTAVVLAGFVVVYAFL